MKSLRLVSFVVLTAFLAAGVVRAQDNDQEKEKRELREKILKKVDERLKRETERIKKEIEAILEEELGAARRPEKKPETRPEKKPEKQPEKTGDATPKEHGWFGTWIEPLSPDLAKEIGVKRESGAVISDVVAGGPAEKAGLKKNDLVLSFDGKKVDDAEELLAQVKATAAGDKVKVVVQRKDGKETLTVEMGKRPSGATVGKVPPQKKEEGNKATVKVEQPKVEKRPGDAQGKLRERIKGFLDKMMSEEEGQPEDAEEKHPAIEKHAGPKAERPGGKLQDRIRDFMERMGGGEKKQGEDLTDEDEDEGEDEDSMRDEGTGFEQLGEIAKRFFDEILKDRNGGSDEEGMEEGEDEGEGPGFEKLLEGARDWMEKNSPEMKKRLEGLREGLGEGRDKMGEGAQGLRDQVQRLLEGLQGENGEDLRDMLQNMDFGKLREQFQDMFQGGDWEKYLGGDEGDESEEDEDLEESGKAPVAKKPEKKSPPAEREATGPAGGAFLGVTLDEVSDELRAHHDLGDRGVMVTTTVEGGAAAKAGIKQWDILLRYDGKDVTSIDGLIDAVQAGKPGQKVQVVVLRRGKEKTVEVELAGRPHSPAPKFLRPFHFVSAGLPDGMLFAPGADPKKDEAAKKQDKKPAARRSTNPDQMREQMMKGLDLFRSFMKDQELYWQVTTKDGKVFYKRKIDPNELAQMARDGGRDWLQGMLAGRRGGRVEGPSRAPSASSGPSNPLTATRKGGVRVYEAPGIRIEIREDVAPRIEAGKQVVREIVRDLPEHAGKAIEGARIHIEDLADSVEAFELPAEFRGPEGRLRGKLAELRDELDRLLGGAHFEKRVAPPAGSEDDVIFFAHPGEHRKIEIELEEGPGQKRIIRKFEGPAGAVVLTPDGEHCESECPAEMECPMGGDKAEIKIETRHGEKKAKEQKKKPARRYKKGDAI